MSKEELSESIQSGYNTFKELLSKFDTEQLNKPGAVGKWSIKDTVAHIVVHEQRMIWWMKERLSGKCPALPQPYAMPDDELNELNEQIYQDNLDRTWDDILRDLEAVHVEALQLVETSAEEDLFDPDRFHLQTGEPLWEAIAANTFSHYEEHSRDYPIVKSGYGSSNRGGKG
ncbi:MAG TPA: ClbS/DfsB family four-helix bundle protein [Anaerolineales bacterium]|nr:ClbS/DfsB family four-helix bundle protein [Anaerolineales bacterium]